MTPATLSEFDYVYDAAGQLASETDMQAGINSGTPWTKNYTQDAQGQLTGDGTNTYSYDLGGNRAAYTYVENPDEVHETNLIASDGAWDYTYDAEGNITAKVNIATDVSWVYKYDNATRLVTVQKFSENPFIYGTGGMLLEAHYKYNA